MISGAVSAKLTLAATELPVLTCSHFLCLRLWSWEQSPFPISPCGVRFPHLETDFLPDGDGCESMEPEKLQTGAGNQNLVQDSHRDPVCSL